MKNNLYIDVHALQILPPSCVNRDDTGSPKTAVYGGTNRGRVSSQSWKRAIREYFKHLFNEEDLGYRTLKCHELVKNEILAIDPSINEKKADDMASKALSLTGINVKKAEKVTDALTFVSQAQAHALAELILAGEKDKKVYKKAFNENPSIDLALFGRMVASDSTLNVEAACQVAHAITVNAAANEYDYFTAVDDLKTEGSAGAGHLGTKEFNSGTFYRYADINIRELYRQIGSKTPETVAGFIEAFVKSMPTGSVKSYANNTLPEDVYVSIRTDQPVSFVAAFEEPVKVNEEGFTKQAAKKMSAYGEKVYSQYVDRPVLDFHVGDSLEDFGKKVSMKDLVNEIKEYLEQELTGGE